MPHPVLIGKLLLEIRHGKVREPHLLYVVRKARCYFGATVQDTS